MLIYNHKERRLDAVQRHHPARHYVMVGGKLRVFKAMKRLLRQRLTTVFLHQRHYALDPAVALSNLFITMPATPEGIPAIEQSIFDGVPINVTLLFSRVHYVAAAQAYLRGIERRVEAGLDLTGESVASPFVSRWDVAVKELLQPPLHNRLGIAIARQTHMTGMFDFSLPLSDRQDDGERIVEIARREGREEVGCTVLGRCADEVKVRAVGSPSLQVCRAELVSQSAAPVFWDAVAFCRAQTMTRVEAATQIARRQRERVDIFERRRSSRPAGAA